MRVRTNCEWMQKDRLLDRRTVQKGKCNKKTAMERRRGDRCSRPSVDTMTVRENVSVLRAFSARDILRSSLFRVAHRREMRWQNKGAQGRTLAVASELCVYPEQMWDVVAGLQAGEKSPRPELTVCLLNSMMREEKKEKKRRRLNKTAAQDSRRRVNYS